MKKIFSIIYICLFVLILCANNDVSAAKQKMNANNFKKFCQTHPFNRNCMGVFASGGKKK
jgi:hypothetical protein